MVVKNPSDFVGSALGVSEQLTKGILAATIGRVLVIDEAYGLYGGGSIQGSSNDPYKTSVIDTIVAEVQSVPGDDRCVLLLGYKDQMEAMFQNVNPGLSRRFPMASAFTFDDFSDHELEQILDLKLKQQGFEVTGQAKSVALSMLGRARNRPHVGNAGESDIILNQAKETHNSRLSTGLSQSATRLEAVDFDENFDRAERAETNIKKLFEGTVGAEDIVNRLQSYQDSVRKMRALSVDPKEFIPFNFIFQGPPGTGKTTTARKIGKVFYDMGFLSTAEVVECSATDLIGQYVGQTGPKVQQQLDKALGKVLFVDEAYRLAEGMYAKEAVDELVDSVTKLKYHKKMVIILAGYTTDMQRLLSVNEGLTSRFPEVISFRNLAPNECVLLLLKLLNVQKTALQRKSTVLNIDALESASKDSSRLFALFSNLSKQKSWANARDIETLSKRAFYKAINLKSQAKGLLMDEDMVVSEATAFFEQRQSRNVLNTIQPTRNTSIAAGPAVEPRPEMRNWVNCGTTHKCDTTTTKLQRSETSEASLIQNKPRPDHLPRRNKQGAQRDSGVSDETWEQLQLDRKAEQAREQEYQELLASADKAREADRAKILKRLIEEEERREREEKIMVKLRELGACPAGYAWIKQENGYRCEGGSHFMANQQL